MPERWPKVERIYSAVVARPEPEWATVLAELCAGDDSLRHEVESLLEHENAASRFLETPACAGADVTGHLASERVLVGRRFGSYTVLAPIGSGGHWRRPKDRAMAPVPVATRRPKSSNARPICARLSGGDRDAP